MKKSRQKFLLSCYAAYLGRKGGKSRSLAKQAASRRNGLKWGGKKKPISSADMLEQGPSETSRPQPAEVSAASSVPLGPPPAGGAAS